MAAEGLDVPSPGADVKFTAEMSERMTVPRHILPGGTKDGPQLQHQRASAQTQNPTAMVVPDRILVAPNSGGQMDREKPLEMDLEQRMGPKDYRDKVLLSTPPSTLTLAGGAFPNEGPSESSMGRPEPVAVETVADPSTSHPEWFRHMGLPYSPPGSGRSPNPLEDIAALKRDVRDLKNRLAELEVAADRASLHLHLFYLFFFGYGGFKAVKMALALYR